jgi:hypothetical protein
MLTQAARRWPCQTAARLPHRASSITDAVLLITALAMALAARSL